VEASRKDWLGGRQFDVDRYLHGATLEETVATGVYCLVTGKRRDSNVYFVRSGGTWVLVDTAWRGRAELIRSAAETLFGAGARPRAIVLTHVHPDHAGSASGLAHMWDVTVYVHHRDLCAIGQPLGDGLRHLLGVPEHRFVDDDCSHDSISCSHASKSRVSPTSHPGQGRKTPRPLLNHLWFLARRGEAADDSDRLHVRLGSAPPGNDALDRNVPRSLSAFAACP